MLLYEMLIGQSPFHGDSEVEIGDSEVSIMRLWHLKFLGGTI